MRVLLVLVLLGSLALVKASGDTIFEATKGTEYELNGKLKTGDVIKAWGVYKDHSTAKFSVNIMKSSDPGSEFNLLHVDFRPYDNKVVLNNQRAGKWQWQKSVRLSRSEYTFDGLFEVKIVVRNDDYRIFFNGRDLGKSFPRRDNIAGASFVVLQGGSNGFEWKALQLPASVLNLGVRPVSGEHNKFEKNPDAGDIISASGIYAAGTSTFNIELISIYGQNGVRHINMQLGFRPDESEVIMNSRWYKWQQEVRVPMPTLEHGKPFKVDIKCLEDEFEVSVNGQVLESRFPYRYPTSLDAFYSVIVNSGSNGMQWTDLVIPGSGLAFENPLVPWNTVTSTTQSDTTPTYPADFSRFKGSTETYYVKIPCETDQAPKINFFDAEKQSAYLKINNLAGGVMWCAGGGYFIEGKYYLGDKDDFSFTRNLLGCVMKIASTWSLSKIALNLS